MSILQHDIPGARVLDLFAGSGALGLEALSRGAVSADFVERGTASLRALAANIDKLGASEETTVHRMDALKFAEGLGPGEYDLAFADPPAARWLETPFAAIFSVEHAASSPMPEAADTRRYGTTAITIYRIEG